MSLEIFASLNPHPRNKQVPERTADLPYELIAKAVKAAAAEAEVPHANVLQAFAVDDVVVQEHLRNTGGSRTGRWGAETFKTTDDQNDLNPKP